MTVTQISATLRHTVDTVIAAEARSHALTIDRPAEKGGTDKGPMGGELLLLALGGCFLSTLIGVLAADGEPLSPGLVDVEVTGVLAAAPTRFARITVAVRAPEDLRESLAQPLLKAERGCIVHNSIKGAIDVVFEHHWKQAA